MRRVGRGVRTTTVATVALLVGPMSVACDGPLLLLDTHQRSAAPRCERLERVTRSEYELVVVELPDSEAVKVLGAGRDPSGGFVMRTDAGSYRLDADGWRLDLDADLAWAYHRPSNTIWTVAKDGALEREGDEVGRVDLLGANAATLAASSTEAAVAILGDDQLVVRFSNGRPEHAAPIRELRDPKLAPLPGGGWLFDYEYPEKLLGAEGGAVDVPTRGGYWFVDPERGLANVIASRVCSMDVDGTELDCWEAMDDGPWSEDLFAVGIGLLVFTGWGEVIWRSPRESEVIQQLPITSYWNHVYRDGFVVIGNDRGREVPTDLALFWFQRSDCLEYTRAHRPQTPR